MAESEEVDEDEHKPGKPKRRCGYVKMKRLNGQNSKVTTPKVEDHLAQGSTTYTDGYTPYKKLNKSILSHKSKSVDKNKAHTLFPWVHSVISNAKKWLNGVHSHIADDFLENYLNEFCYKVNRRYHTDLLGRLLNAAISNRWNYLGELNG